MHEEVSKYFKAIGRKGGRTTVSRMTKEELRIKMSKIGKIGARNRWAKYRLQGVDNSKTSTK